MNDNLRIEKRPIEALLPYARNARTHSEAQVAQIAASMVEFGWTNPVLVDGDNGIIAGHGRVMAARKLGLETVPVIELAHLSETQKRAYILADNKIALNAGWDEEMLRVELDALREADFNLDLTGFDANELKAFFDCEPDAESCEPSAGDDDVPEVQENVVSVPGDVWILGKHRIMCGDATVATDVEKLLAGAAPHLMVTDPPYGVEYDPEWRNDAGISNTGRTGRVLNDDRADWREAWSLFPGEVAYVWHAGLFAATVQESLEACDFAVRSQIIWAKPRLVLSRGHYHWQHEPCWYAVKKGATGHWEGGRDKTTLWSIDSREEDSRTSHGTQKPLLCMLLPILNNSVKGDAVYEPFSGSGTTLIACEKSERVCLAMELNPAYVDVAVRRWQNFTGERAVRESDGVKFEADAD
ncbi:site-specific DNA-methyltransferase [uncultured Desulfovibrio sp.]|uniref:site-specific DNA-methyltransferase n=1 Tax=uncultured Desulfovibrio sp. TaxID=167968 RepID=UPI002047103F|nr:site-specific DNA-methyltransferase [uncultured Desulfovibrio sp.]DAV75450.1 MAG TPA: adenine specific DNA methyltransferase [Caudoviricetes sp.]